MQTDASYTIGDLARLTGLNVRTIRYYIAQGLIPASGESGPGAHYGEGHLGRLRLTRRLQQQHLPLAEIRDRLAALSDAEVAELASAASPAVEPVQTSALEYVRSLLGGQPPEPRPLPPDVVAMPALSVSPGKPVPPGATPRRGFVGPPGFKTGRSGPSLSARIASKVQQANPDHERVVASLAEEAVAHAAPAGAHPASDMPARDVPGPAPAPATQAPERSQWDRHALGPNIELHVRRPLSRLEQRRVERLITIARQVVKEDGV